MTDEYNIPPLPKNLEYKYNQKEWNNLYRSMQKKDRKLLELAKTFFTLAQLSNGFQQDPWTVIDENVKASLLQYIETAKLKSYADYLKMRRMLSPVYAICKYLSVIENDEARQISYEAIRNRYPKYLAYMKAIYNRTRVPIE